MNNNRIIILLNMLVDKDGIFETNEVFWAFCNDDHICAFNGLKWFFVYFSRQNKQKFDIHLWQVRWPHFLDFSMNFPQSGQSWIDLPLTTSAYLTSVSWWHDCPLCQGMILSVHISNPHWLHLVRTSWVSTLSSSPHFIQNRHLECFFRNERSLA